METSPYLEEWSDIRGDARRSTGKGTLLKARLSKTEIVKMEIELPKPEHPWKKFAGMFKEDPDFDDVLADIEAFRRDRDAEMEAYYRQLD